MVFDSKWQPPQNWLQRLVEDLDSLGADGVQDLLAVLAALPADRSATLIDKTWAYFVESGAAPGVRVLSTLLLSPAVISEREERLKQMVNVSLVASMSWETTPGLYQGFEDFADPANLVVHGNPLGAAIRRYGTHGYLKEEINEALEAVAQGEFVKSRETLALAILLSPDSWEERKVWVDKLFAGMLKDNHSDLDMSRGLLIQLPAREFVLYMNHAIRLVSRLSHGYPGFIAAAIERSTLTDSEKAALWRNYEKSF